MIGNAIEGAPVLVAALVWAVAAATTALTLVAASRHGWLAQPNARSSHTAPIPTAGGFGFIVPMLVWLALSANAYPPALAMALAGTGVAVVGFVDDLMELRRDVRLGCHLTVACGCVFWLFEPSALTAAVLIIGLAWWVNLYNFMDGIDGFAASQAAVYAGGALLLGDLEQSAAFAWVVFAASLGFLLFNWAPAKIFMGDAGSGFLGLTTGLLALWLWHADELPIVGSAIQLIGFWFDASYTLAVRIVTRQAFADGHRSHLYQVVSRRLGHGRTTALLWLHAAVWLAPLAGLAIAFPAWQFACLLAACLPIAVACVLLKAGAAGC